MNWIRLQWDRAAALAAFVIGALAMLFAWIGVSGQAYVARQTPYIVSGAMFGILMVAVAATLWLSADLRDEWRELRRIRLQGEPAVATDGLASDLTVELPAVSEADR